MLEVEGKMVVVRVPVPKGHRDKRFGERVDSIVIQFESEEVLGVRESRLS